MMTLRARKKAQTQDALVEAAYALFSKHGYESVTVEQIAEKANISRRTFFRYFACKEAVVFPKNDERLDRFVELLQRKPNETPAAAVGRAFLEIGAHFMEHREEMVAQNELVRSSPGLLAYERELDQAWESAIAKTLLDSERSARAHRRASILAGAVMGAVRAILREWYAKGGRADLVRIGQEGLSLLEEGLQISSGAPAPDSP